MSPSARSQRGFQMSERGRRKISDARKDKPLTAKQRAVIDRMNVTNLGRIKSPEERAKLSAVHKGKVFSPEHCANISLAKKGTIVSAETRAKLSAMRLGKKKRPMSAQARANISAAKTGKRYPRKYTESKVEEIKRLINGGKNTADIAVVLNIDRGTVYRWLKLSDTVRTN